jgi:hypothetical protein
MNETNNETSLQQHQRRVSVANAIASLLAIRFPWLGTNPHVYTVLRAYLNGAVTNGNDSGLTLESTMSVLLDALQEANTKIKEDFVNYINTHH